MLPGERLTFACVALIVGIAMLELANYLEMVLPILPKHLYFGMMAVAIALLLTSNRLALSRVRPSMVAFVVALMAINLMHLFAFADAYDGESAQIALSRLQFVLLGFGIALTTTVLPHRRLAALFAGCAVLIVLSMLFDMLFPQVMYPWTTPGSVPGRVGSFYVNANKAGEAAVLGALLAMPMLRRSTAALLLVLTGIAILTTFSRAAMIGWVLLAGIYWMAGLLGRVQLAAIALALVVLGAGGSLFAVFVDAQNLPTVDATDITNRLNFLTTGDLGDDSAQERAFVRDEGVRVFLEHPLAGAGAGGTLLWEHPVGPHNQVVLMAGEYGIAGIALWGVMVWLVATGSYLRQRSLQWGAAAVVVLFSMTSHTLLDFPYWMLAMLVLAMRFGPRQPVGEGGFVLSAAALPAKRSSP